MSKYTIIIAGTYTKYTLYGIIILYVKIGLLRRLTTKHNYNMMTSGFKVVVFNNAVSFAATYEIISITEIISNKHRQGFFFKSPRKQLPVVLFSRYHWFCKDCPQFEINCYIIF